MSEPRVNIHPPKKESFGYSIKSPWMLRQADGDYVDLEAGGVTLYVPGEEEPVVVETSVTFEIDGDGRVTRCRAAVVFNMPDGNHRELGSLDLDACAMFAECFQLETKK
jgi:hypothetical protein